MRIRLIPSSYIKCDENIQSHGVLKRRVKGLPTASVSLSEMNSVSDLMATWAKFTLRGSLLGDITVTEMVSWESLLVRFNIFFFFEVCFLYVF